MTDRLTFTVHGKPAPQGSKRHIGKGIMVESSKRLKPWREDVRAAALAVIFARALPVFGRGVPLQLTVNYFFARPRSHYRTGKKSQLLRDDAPVWHTQKPDRDKLDRALGDALTGIVWDDDCQIVTGTPSKVWGERDKMDVVVERLT